MCAILYKAIFIFIINFNLHKIPVITNEVGVAMPFYIRGH